MSTLLRATTNLEATRLQIYKDVLSALLSGLASSGQTSVQAQERLLSVLHGQLLGMEGRLKEQRAARMAALAAQCNLETREEMEAEHHREAAEKTTAELLCRHADQQVKQGLVSLLCVYFNAAPSQGSSVTLGASALQRPAGEVAQAEPESAAAHPAVPA